VAEELWGVLGEGRLWETAWPEADPALLVHDEVEIAVQVNGKVRDRLTVSATIEESELLALALASERVQAYVDGKELRKTVVVPGRLVSLVV
jgi:leucyl-tRNA synthetase